MAARVKLSDVELPRQIRKRMPEESTFDGAIYLAGRIIRDFQAAEQFRMLRARIHRLNIDRMTCQIFAVTSALAHEGKTVTAVNLARALSIDPLGKTLLIDGDLRKPSIHKFFGVDEGPGLADILLGKESVYNTLISVSPGLDIIRAGTMVGDPSELMARPAFADVLNFARLEYRYAIIDTPPAALCAEPITVSTYADATLLVVRGWYSDKAIVKDAIERIGRERIFGVVLNEVREGSAQYSQHHGYYAPRPASAV